jgi:hypothetical protein
MKKLLFSFFLLIAPFVSVGIAECAIAQGNTTSWTSTAATNTHTDNITHNNDDGAGNVVVLFAQFSDRAGNVESATYNGSAMTQLVNGVDVDTYRGAIYYIVAGASGSNTLAVNSYTGAIDARTGLDVDSFPKRRSYYVITLNGVDQSTPVGQSGLDYVTASPFTTAVTLTGVLDNSFIYSNKVGDNSFSSTPSGGIAQIARPTSTWGSEIIASDTTVSAGNLTQTFTGGVGNAHYQGSVEFLEGTFADDSTSAIFFGSGF